MASFHSFRKAVIGYTRFGTQAIPALQEGKENAPIGFRFSDDDGYTWSDVHLIKPENDPNFKGMSVMRMCETASGVWLLGSHEATWQENKLLSTRQYVLRSTNQGKTWTVLPHPRPRGWCRPLRAKGGWTKAGRSAWEAIVCCS